jgi:hypothetical protein
VLSWESANPKHQTWQGVQFRKDHLTGILMDISDMFIHLVHSASGILTSMIYTLLFRAMYSFLVADHVWETAEARSAASNVTEDSRTGNLHNVWLLMVEFLHQEALATLSEFLVNSLVWGREKGGTIDLW